GAELPANTTLPGGASYLFANATPTTGYSLSVPADATFTTGIADNGGLQLRNAAGTVIDAVGSTDTVAAFREGAGLAFTTVNGPRNAAIRKNNGTQDTHNNPSDFHIQQP